MRHRVAPIAGDLKPALGGEDGVITEIPAMHMHGVAVMMLWLTASMNSESVAVPLSTVATGFVSEEWSRASTRSTFSRSRSMFCPSVPFFTDLTIPHLYVRVGPLRVAAGCPCPSAARAGRSHGMRVAGHLPGPGRQLCRTY